jgi:hypothetical protein
MILPLSQKYLRACLVSPNWAEFNWIPESTLFGSPWNRMADFNWFPTGRIRSPPRIPKKNVGNLRILNATTTQSLVPDSTRRPYRSPSPSSVVGTSGITFHRRRRTGVAILRRWHRRPRLPPKTSGRTFPDQILRNIVSCLPTKDVVRSSALASRWRSLGPNNHEVQTKQSLPFVRTKPCRRGRTAR